MKIEIDAPFYKFYVCESCGTKCYFCVTNDHNSLPRPDKCPYEKSEELSDDADFVPEWKEVIDEKS